MSQAAIRSIFGVCVYMVYIYTHTQSNPYIYIHIYCRDVAPSTVMSVWLKPLLESCKEIERLRAQ